LIVLILIEFSLFNFIGLIIERLTVEAKPIWLKRDSDATEVGCVDNKLRDKIASNLNLEEFSSW
jgi:hypothetical protein